MQYWPLVTPPALLLILATAFGAPRDQSGVSDELERLVGVLVPIVAALLSPLLGAVVLLFRQLVSEMRESRSVASSVARVVSANTAAFEANTRATERLSEGLEAMGERLARMEARIERMEMQRQHGLHQGGAPP